MGRISGLAARCAAGRAERRRGLGVRRLGTDERGSATIEFAIWLPLFCLLLIITADLGMLLMRHANMWDIARDATRRIAMYEMSSAEAEAHVASRLGGQSEAVVVEATDGDEVSVLISIPTADVVPFGVFSAAMDGTVVAKVTMLKEPI